MTLPSLVGIYPFQEELFCYQSFCIKPLWAELWYNKPCGRAFLLQTVVARIVVQQNVVGSAVVGQAFLLQTVVARIVVQQNVVGSAVVGRAFLLQIVIARIVVQQSVVGSAVVARAAVELDQFWDQYRGAGSGLFGPILVPL